MAVGGQHASGGHGGGPVVPEPSYAERARTLAYLGRTACLSTLSRKQPGFPFGSVMPYALDAHGRPLFLISNMAMHTQNLAADPRASLLITPPESNLDPLGSARLTLIGPAAPLPTEDLPAARELYLARYENARHWVDYEDFGFYRLDVIDLYFVGGFGVMGWVDAASYREAQPDPLADAGPGILRHMNADHADALVLLARHFGGFDLDNATMTAVDRLGFHVRMQKGERIFGGRLGFLREVRTPEEARAVLVEMVRQARGAV
jgi:putative heme iron utilization protein